MPTTLYNKESILDACISVFAQYGYKTTSTQALADAAGVSKALLFHHFKNKKELYLCVLNRCIENYHAEIDTSRLASVDFFDALEVYSPIKLEYCKKHPDFYFLLRDAFLAAPKPLRKEIEQIYSFYHDKQYTLWLQRFDFVPLKTGVNRGQALELIMMTLDGFEQRFTTALLNGQNADTAYLESFIDKVQNYIRMIRFGIEEVHEDD